MLSRPRSGRDIRALIIAIIIGLTIMVIVFALGRYLLPGGTRTYRIVAAKRDIKAWERITPEDVNLVEVKAKKLSPYYFTSISQVIGRTPVIDIRSGQKLHQGMFRVPNQELAKVLPEGTYGFVFPLNTPSLYLQAQNLMPGDRIDVLAEIRDEITNERMVVEVAQNLLVVEVNYGEPLDSAEQGRVSTSRFRFTTNRSQRRESKVPRSLVLAVTPDQAYALKLASQTGNVSILVRSLKGGTPLPTSSAKTLNEYLREKGILPPKAVISKTSRGARFKASKVTLIKGTTAQEVPLGGGK